MSRFHFEVATVRDDQALRDLLGRTPMDGQMRICFRREPSFFAAAAVEGNDHQTLVCRDAQAENRIVAMGSRATRRCWINSQPETIGYLSGLRIDPAARGHSVLARGYQLLRQLHEQHPLSLYISTVAEGNQRAWKLLTSGRAGLPRYQHIGDYHSIAIPLSRSPQGDGLPKRHGDYELRFATGNELPSLLRFWNDCGYMRQLFPVMENGNFDSVAGTLRGLQPENILLAEYRGEIVGTLGCWDQTSFRQTVVHDYGWYLERARPAINVLARLRGRAGLPKVGQPLALLFAALPVVRSDHIRCFAPLLQACARMCGGGPFSHLILGLSADDPLRAEVPQRCWPVYRTRVCSVHWNSEPPALQLAKDRCMYLEAGSL